MSSQIVKFLICLTPAIALRSDFRTGLQTRFDALEERYDRDYVLIKDELRDLWTAFEYLSTNCCVEHTVPVAKSLPLTTETIDRSGQHNTPATDCKYDALRRALAQEKRFLREKIKSISDVTDDIEENRKSGMEFLIEQLQRLEENMRNFELRNRELNETLRQTINRFENEILMTKNKLENYQTYLNEAVQRMEREADLQRPNSCTDLIKFRVTTSGVYTLFDGMQSYTVFCLMRQGGGYTFIYPETLISVNISALSNDYSHVLIRHRRTDGLQYESRIEQIARYAYRPISVQYNSHSGYNGPVNSKMTPYVYVGLTPRTLEDNRSHKGDTQGYRTNGKDITFINCDGNPNGYFAFLFNHNGVSSSGSYSPAVVRQWVDTAVRVSDVAVPDKFLSSFELHFGGCGAFASMERVGGVTGAAVGIPFKM